MIKSGLKYILQKILGFEKYLFVFSKFIIRKLPWDKKERDFLFFLKLLSNDGVVLDIGANIGVMSYYLSTRKPNAQIIAFEPLAVNYSNIEKIITAYKLKNITIAKYALGDSEGEVEMVMPVINSVKFHGLSHVVHSSISEYNEGNKFMVPIHKLDDLDEVNGLGKKINGIKIDVENFEYFVLKGGVNLIKKDRPIIYAELWECENRVNTFELLKALNYTVKIVENNELKDFDNQHTQNFIFLP